MCCRLLLAALCLSVLPAFAQDHLLNSGNADRNTQQVPDFRTPPASTASEPWRILPKQDSDREQGVVMSAKELGDLGLEGIGVSPDGRLMPETTCYAIRSYVVARDHKHSDSVHPAGYTTCVPATRYRLKTADAHITP